MTEPEDYINAITGVIDPFHIIIPKMDPKVRKYRDLVHRYNMIYYDMKWINKSRNGINIIFRFCHFFNVVSDV